MRKEVQDLVMHILKQRVKDNEHNISSLIEKQVKGKLSNEGANFMAKLIAENVLIMEASDYIYKGENNE